MPPKKKASPKKKAPTRRSLDKAKHDDKLWVSSYVELAGRLGVSRRTITRWREVHADHPKGRPNGDHSVKNWEEFIKEKGLSANSDGKDPNQGALPEGVEGLLTKDELGRMDLKVKIAERAFKLARDKGDYIHSEVVRETIMGLAAEAIKLLRDRLENELPPIIEGQDAVFIRVEMEKVVSDFCDAIHSGFGIEEGLGGSEIAPDKSEGNEQYDEEGETEDFSA